MKKKRWNLPLTKQLDKLNSEQILEVDSVIREASIAHALDGNFKEVFRRRKLTTVGYLNKLYSFLESISWDEMEYISGLITELSKPKIDNVFTLKPLNTKIHELINQ